MHEQVRLLKTLLSPAFEYMELVDFGKALNKAYSEHQRAMAGLTTMPTPEASAWWNCIAAIYQIAMVRFGAQEWAQYLRQNPSIYIVTD